MEHIRAFDNKYKNFYKQFESSLKNLRESERNCEQTSLVQLNLFKVFKLLSDLELLILAVEMKVIRQRIRVEEFAKLGGVPRNEMELLFHYTHFHETKLIESKQVVASHMKIFPDFQLGRNLHFNFNLLPNF